MTVTAIALHVARGSEASSAPVASSEWLLQVADLLEAKHLRVRLAGRTLDATAIAGFGESYQDHAGGERFKSDFPGVDFADFCEALDDIAMLDARDVTIDLSGNTDLAIGLGLTDGVSGNYGRAVLGTRSHIVLPQPVQYGVTTRSGAKFATLASAQRGQSSVGRPSGSDVTKDLAARLVRGVGLAEALDATRRFAETSHAAGWAAPLASISAAQTRALLIGNGAYPRSPLEAPPANVTLMRGGLQRVGVPAARITTRADLAGDEIVAEIRQALSAAQPGERVVLYFSGHGTGGRLCGVDGKDPDVTSGPIAAAITAARARHIEVVLIMQACHSGAATDVAADRDLAEAEDAARGDADRTVSSDLIGSARALIAWKGDVVRAANALVAAWREELCLAEQLRFTRTLRGLQRMVSSDGAPATDRRVCDLQRAIALQQDRYEVERRRLLVLFGKVGISQDLVEPFFQAVNEIAVAAYAGSDVGPAKDRATAAIATMLQHADQWIKAGTWLSEVTHDLGELVRRIGSSSD